MNAFFYPSKRGINFAKIRGFKVTDYTLFPAHPSGLPSGPSSGPSFRSSSRFSFPAFLPALPFGPSTRSSSRPLRPVLLPAPPPGLLPGPPHGPPSRPARPVSGAVLLPTPAVPSSRPSPPSRRATLFFGEEDDGWARNFINFLILEKEGQTRFLQ